MIKERAGEREEKGKVPLFEGKKMERSFLLYKKEKKKSIFPERSAA